MSGKHAKFAPSSADRVVTCPASFLFTQDMPNPPSVFAVHGTVAHYIHEQCLLDPNKKAERYVGMHPIQFMPDDELEPDEWALIPYSHGVSPDTDFIWTQELADYTQESIDYCMGIGGDTFVEQRLSISNYTPIPDQFGTSDFIAITRGGVMWVVDLKFGEGVKVYAERNLQAVLYALGALDEHDFLYDIKKVVVVISQPRLDHRDVWETTPEELREIGAYIKERFTLALQSEAPFNPSEKACKFCPGKATCPALAQRAVEIAQGMFDDITSEIEKPDASKDWPLSTPDAKLMTPEHTALVLEHANMLRGFLDAVEAHATHLLMHNQPVPGYKLVEGRSARVITDVSGYEAHLRNNGVEPFKSPQLITLTDAEKALKGEQKKLLSQFMTKPPGRPTIAHESDKRPAMQVTSASMFEDESANDEGL